MSGFFYDVAFGNYIFELKFYRDNFLLMKY